MTSPEVRLSYITNWHDNAERANRPLSIDDREDSSEMLSIGILEILFEACIYLYKRLLREMEDNDTLEPYQSVLQRYLGVMYLWAQGFGVGRGELDDVLNRSLELRDAVLNILIHITDFQTRAKFLFGLGERSMLIKTKDLMHFATASRETHESISLDSGIDDDAPDEDFEPYEDIGEILEDLDTYTDCLSALGTAIDSPLRSLNEDDLEHARPPNLVANRDLYQDHVDLLLAKFPQGNKSVLEILGRANWERYRRLKLEKDINDEDIRSGFRSVRIAQPAKSIIASTVFQDSGYGG
ncbi:hypothetical protein LTR28_009175 [Elasticomyces elasticus]|nr:hypothetical protein LTR28_009175 [Elasticomyces elasticus]